eukprot:TRINITY_DN2145_c0_g4_i1.p1 TRINITY_DN2145_c0_g4~~TRINITY_DN2145_c0_g4_i1.p1  ORF type:complete len:1148 (+),score=277.18 TRINITY_DN2145_c0_g4_i1:35-3478(+)
MLPPPLLLLQLLLLPLLAAAQCGLNVRSDALGDIVVCGAVRPGFALEEDAVRAAVPLGTSEVMLEWWSADEELRYTLDYAVGVAASAAAVSPTTAYNGTMSVALARAGSVPRAPAAFAVVLACAARFTASAQLVFSLAAVPDGGGAPRLLAPLAFGLRWECVKPGCSGYCSSNGGTCEELLAQCDCPAGWVGPYCALQYTLESFELCPGEPIVMTYYAPTSMAGYDMANVEVWYGVLTLDYQFNIDWRYLMTWSTVYPTEDNPLFTQPLNGTSIAPLYLDPGWHPMDVYIGTSAFVIYEMIVTIKDWSECGYNASCLPGANQCNEALGYGSCGDNGWCSCGPGHFWYDCSRGCSTSAVLANAAGSFSSDHAPEGLPMTYLIETTCAWLISPTGSFDEVVLDFTFFSIENADVVSIFKSDAAGTTGELVLALSGPLGPTKVTVKSQHVLIQFVSDYATAGYGFTVEYSTRKNPFPKVAIVAIAVSIGFIGFLVAAAAIVLLGISVVTLLRWRRRLLEEALYAPPYIVPPMELEALVGQVPDPEEGAASLKLAGVTSNKFVLDFGLASRDVCPVQDLLQDSIVLTNLSGHSKPYRFFIPENTFKYECDLKPGRGVIPPHRQITVNITFKLLYTAHVQLPLRLEVAHSRDITSSTASSASSFTEDNTTSTFFQIQLEGALSDRLDPEDISLEPIPLATGGFGTVFRGVYRSQLVAVKVLKHQEALATDEEKEFIGECELLKRLHHNYIVSYVGACMVPGRYCVCTELIPHGNLRTLLQSHKDVPYALILKFATNIAEAMTFLHINKVIYRDLKCSNVLVVSTASRAQVSCKLTDFGTARNVENPEEMYDYTHGVGTPIYMAPELFVHDSRYNFLVDVYSYSMLMFEMWAREEPWSQEVCWDIPHKVLSGARPPFPEEPALSRPSAEPPADYVALMQQCWSHDPAGRPMFADITDRVHAMLHAMPEFVESDTPDLPSEDCGVGLTTTTSANTNTSTRTGAATGAAASAMEAGRRTRTGTGGSSSHRTDGSALAVTSNDHTNNSSAQHTEPSGDLRLVSASHAGSTSVMLTPVGFRRVTLTAKGRTLATLSQLPDDDDGSGGGDRTSGDLTGPSVTGSSPSGSPARASPVPRIARHSGGATSIGLGAGGFGL